MNRERTTTAILVFCVLSVGAAGVGAAATADESSLTLDREVYFEEDNIRVTFTEPDVSTERNYIMNIRSQTETHISEEKALPSFISEYTTDDPVSDRNNDGIINKSDFEYTYSGFASNSIDSVQRNQDNTVTILFTGETDFFDDLRYDRGETVTLSHAGGSTFTGTIDISSTDAKGILNVNDGGEVTVRYNDRTPTKFPNFDSVERKDIGLIRSKALEIKTVAEQPQLIDNNTSVTIRLFQQDQQRIIKRTTSNGKISLAKFPEDTQFTVVAEAPGFVTRRTFLSNIREQQYVYLLDNQTDTSLVRFTLEDRTGEFSGNQKSTLKIQRSINTTDSGRQGEEYQTISGDFIGGQLAFDSELENNVRYRVSVSNQNGDTRQLGAFLIKSPREINLVISGIDQGVDVPKRGPVISTSQQTQNNSKTLDFVYTDNASQTSDVTVKVENARNSSEVFDTGSDSGDISQFKFSTIITGDDAEKQIVANYTYVRDGQVEQATQPYGSNTYPVLTELDQGWASIFGVGFLIITGSLFSVRNARIGALVIPGVALLLNLVGILDGVVTLASVGLAFSIGIGVNLISNGFLR